MRISIMVVARKYFKKQCSLSMFKLEHHTSSDFSLSCWQKNRSTVPLLCTRGVIFLGCLAILLSSLILTGLISSLKFWPIYMTQWGVVLITITSGLAFAVSLRAYTKGLTEEIFELPWLLKAFWAFSNIAISSAFFITIYYYVLLYPYIQDSETEYEVDPVLDVLTHGMNSVLMLLLLMTSRHPSRLLHFIYPLCFGIIYLAFTGIYYVAGGTNTYGEEYIYPMLDWSNPGLTSGLAAACAGTLILIHWLVVAMTAVRDALARCCRKDFELITISNLPKQ